MYDDFFEKANELVQKGQPFVTATVVRAEKPTSAKPGDRAIITVDGVMYGWIGGSCAQPSVIKEALKALAADECQLIRLSADPEAQSPREGLVDLPMTCFSGGTLEIMIEPQHPRPRLLIIGNLPIARALIHLGQAMNYHVIVADPDNLDANIAGADEVLTNLGELGVYVQPNTYVVVATHGNYDELALEKVLNANPIYVGFVASPKRGQAVRDYLEMRGFSEEQMVPLKVPAGLDIQAQRGDEIALSIMAEIVQRRRNAELMDLTLFKASGEVDETSKSTPSASESQPETAVDPICGMEVEIASAKFTHEHEDVTYYFCCAGCQTKFSQDPEQYLASEAPSGEAIDPVCNMTVDIASAKYMSEYEDQLIYFCGPGCKEAFDADPAAYVSSEQAVGR